MYRNNNKYNGGFALRKSRLTQKMKCKKYNELRRKKVNESKKKEIVSSYIKDWRKLLLIMILSTSIYYILASVASMSVDLLSNGFRLSLLVLILLAWGFSFITWAKIKPGLLSFAGLMLVVAPVLEFQDPVTSVVFFCLLLSLFMLLIDIVFGVTFKIKVTPVERPWHIDKLNDVKKNK